MTWLLPVVLSVGWTVFIALLMLYVLVNLKG